MKSTICLIVALLLGMLSSNALADAPATEPSKTALERADGIKANIDSFQLLLNYWGKETDGMEDLTLSMSPPPNAAGNPKNAGLTHWVQIDKDQANVIVDYLATEGFLDRAVSTAVEKNFLRGRGKPYYMLTVGGWEEDLGWNMRMLRRMDGLQKVLKGDAAKAMDKVLDKLADQRKKWAEQSKQTIERVKGLKADIKTFHFLLMYDGKPDAAFDSLYLTVAPVGKSDGRISEDQANTLIDRLAEDGFFDCADLVGPNHREVPGSSNSYLMIAGDWQEKLNWGQPLQNGLDVLQFALEGDAKTALQRLIDKMVEAKKRAAAQ